RGRIDADLDGGHALRTLRVECDLEAAVGLSLGARLLAPPADLDDIGAEGVSPRRREEEGTEPDRAKQHGGGDRPGLHLAALVRLRPAPERCTATSDPPKYPATTCGSDNTSAGTPRANGWPASSAINSSLIELMSGMSCSITTIAALVRSRTSNKSGPSASASRCAMPDDGSSSSNTDGRWAITQAKSTMRRLPVDNSPTNLSAKASSPMTSINSETRSS